MLPVHPDTPTPRHLSPRATVRDRWLWSQAVGRSADSSDISSPLQPHPSSYQREEHAHTRWYKADFQSIVRAWIHLQIRPPTARNIGLTCLLFGNPNTHLSRFQNGKRGEIIPITSVHIYKISVWTRNMSIFFKYRSRCFTGGITVSLFAY